MACAFVLPTVVMLLTTLSVVTGQMEAYQRREPDTFGGLVVGDVYDPSSQICCHATAHQRPKRRSYRQCCGDDMFDVTCEVCCDTMVHRRQCGYACCGSHYFNINEALCCRDNHVVKFPSWMKDSDLDYVECCGNATVYDTRTQICSPCDGVSVIDKPHSNTGCCGDDTYNADTHLCCNGHVVKRNDKNVTSCCGKQGYDPYTQICCEDHPVAVEEKMIQYGGCCKRTPFNRHAEDCCGDVVYDILALGCCGEATYNLTSQLCCDGSVVRNKTLPNDTCCGEKVYNRKDHICCLGALHPVEDGKEETKSCCGNSTYDIRNQLCCDEDSEITASVVNLTAPTHRLCCGHRSYDPYSQICCSRESSRVMDVSPPFLMYANAVYDFQCCGNVTYSTSEHLCCQGDNDTATLAGRINGYDECCNGIPYNSQRQMCCGTEVFVRAEHTVCCGDKMIDLDEEVCTYDYDKRSFVALELSPPYFRNNTGGCGTQLYRLPEEDCCDKTVFTPETHICCGDSLTPRPANATMDCCRDKAYNTDTHICCGHELKAKSSPRQISCCYVH